jgi:hypothetical protein
MDEGCTQPLSSDPMINLNTTDFPLDDYSRLRGISTRLESLALNRSTPTHTREDTNRNESTK